MLHPGHSLLCLKSHFARLPQQADNFYAVEVLFTAVFAMELVLNLFGFWFQDFINDPWSVFDFIVVGLSIIGLIIKVPRV